MKKEKSAVKTFFCTMTRGITLETAMKELDRIVNTYVKKFRDEAKVNLRIMSADTNVVGKQVMMTVVFLFKA